MSSQSNAELLVLNVADANSAAEIIADELIAEAAELIAEVEETAPSDIYEAFARFLLIDVANGDATADTIKAYHREVKSYTNWCKARGLAPERARRSHIEAYREELKAKGQNVSTRQHKLSIVRRFYEAAVKHGLLKTNPADRVRGGKDLTPPEEKIKALTTNALNKLMDGIQRDTPAGVRDRAILALMAVHGLRRIEVHRLDHESLQLEEDTAYLVVHGKGNKMRRVYLRPDTYIAITNYIHSKLALGLPLSGALFVAHGNLSRGQRISRRALNWLTDRYLSDSALKHAGVSCHALRHTFGTLSVAGGAKVEHLRDAMGHSSIETTSMYVKAVERAKNNPANFIEVDV